jgi:biopolymer transport protein ExbB
MGIAEIDAGLSAILGTDIVQGTLDIWEKGGWAMYALLGNAMIMFTLETRMIFELTHRGLFISPDRAWRKYWRSSSGEENGGRAKRMIKGAMTRQTLEEAERYFEVLKNDEIAPFERDLKLIKMCVSASPLLGLLGTVTGMLATFGALATGAGGDKTMEMVAGGISEALITTETGLVLALSGLIFQFALTHQHERYGKAIEHLETLCIQRFRQGYLPSRA